MSTSEEFTEKDAQAAIDRIRTIPLRDRLDVGESVGLYRVKGSDPGRLRLEIGAGGALAVFVLGVVFTFLNIWLFGSGWIHFARLLPAWLKGALIGLPILGLFMIFMLGRSYEFARPADARAGAGGLVIRKRWLWFFGPTIDPARVAAIDVLVRPGYSQASADRIQVRLVDPAGQVVLEVADEASDDKDVGATLALATQLAQVLGKPERLEGEPKDMDEYATDVLRRFREKLAAAA